MQLVNGSLITGAAKFTQSLRDAYQGGAEYITSSFWGSSEAEGKKREVQQLESYCNEQVGKVQEAADAADVEGINEALRLITSQKNYGLCRIMADQLRGRLSTTCSEKLGPVIHWMIAITSGGDLGDFERQIRDVTKFLIRLTFEQEKLAKEKGNLEVIKQVLSHHERSEELQPIIQDLEKRINCLGDQIAELDKKTNDMSEALTKFFEQAAFSDDLSHEELTEELKVDQLAYDLINRLPGLKIRFQRKMDELNNQNRVGVSETMGKCFSSTDSVLGLYLGTLETYYESMAEKEPQETPLCAFANPPVVAYLDQDNSTPEYLAWFEADNGNDPLGRTPFSHYCVPEAFDGLGLETEDGQMVNAPIEIAPGIASVMMDELSVADGVSASGEFSRSEVLEAMELGREIFQIWHAEETQGNGVPIDWAAVGKRIANTVKTGAVKAMAAGLYTMTKSWYNAKEFAFGHAETIAETWPEIIVEFGARAQQLIYYATMWEMQGFDPQVIEQNLLEMASGNAVGHRNRDMWSIPASAIIVGNRSDCATVVTKLIAECKDNETFTEEEVQKILSLERMMGKVVERFSGDIAEVISEASHADQHAAAEVLKALLPSGADLKEALISMGHTAEYYEQHPTRLGDVMSNMEKVKPVIDELKPLIREGVERFGEAVENDEEFRVGVQDLEKRGLGVMSNDPEKMHVAMMMLLNGVQAFESLKKEEPWEQFAETCGPNDWEFEVAKSWKEAAREVDYREASKDIAVRVKDLIKTHGRAILQRQRKDVSSQEESARNESVEGLGSQADIHASVSLTRMFDGMPRYMNPMLSVHERGRDLGERIGLIFPSDNS